MMELLNFLYNSYNASTSFTVTANVSKNNSNFQHQFDEYYTIKLMYIEIPQRVEQSAGSHGAIPFYDSASRNRNNRKPRV